MLLFLVETKYAMRPVTFRFFFPFIHGLVQETSKFCLLVLRSSVAVLSCGKKKLHAQRKSKPTVSSDSASFQLVRELLQAYVEPSHWL